MLARLVSELESAEREGDKKQLIRLLVRKEERINKIDRCLTHFQHVWEDSELNLQKKLAITHQLRTGLQSLKETLDTAHLNHLKKDLFQFREFFIVPPNTECNRNTKLQSTAEQNMALYKAYHDARA